VTDDRFFYRNPARLHGTCTNRPSKCRAWQDLRRLLNAWREGRTELSKSRPILHASDICFGDDRSGTNVQDGALARISAPIASSRWLLDYSLRKSHSRHIAHTRIEGPDSLTLQRVIEEILEPHSSQCSRSWAPLSLEENSSLSGLPWCRFDGPACRAQPRSRRQHLAPRIWYAGSLSRCDYSEVRDEG